MKLEYELTYVGGALALRPDQLSFTRRSLLSAGTSALAWGNIKPQTPACALTAEQEEGPYYIDESAVRRNITEGKPGVPPQGRRGEACAT